MTVRCVAWQAEVGPSSLGSPVFSDGLLFVGDQNGRIHAFDGESGVESWTVGDFGGHVSPIAIAGGLLIAGGESEKVEAFALSNRTLAWSFDVDGVIWEAPLVIDDVVYVVSERGAYALDLASGEPIWQVATGDHHGFVGSPAAAAGLLIVDVGPTLLALHRDTGDVAWQITSPEGWYSPPAIGSGVTYLGSDDGYLYALDSATGEQMWRFRGLDGGWSTPAVAGGMVYVGNRDGTLYAVDAMTGTEVWHFTTEDWATSDPIVTDGVLYFGVGNHEQREGPRHLYALDASNGSVLWTFQADARLLTAPALGEGVVFVVTITGTVYAARGAVGLSLPSKGGAALEGGC